MSPEQVAGGSSLDGRSDLFSAGVVLFEMLTGCKPFPAINQYQAMADIREKNASDSRQWNPSIPDGLAAVVTRALRKKPAGRYASAEDFAAALQEFLDSPGKRDEDFHARNGKVSAGPRPGDEDTASITMGHKGQASTGDPLEALFRTTNSRPGFHARIWTERGERCMTRDLQTTARQHPVSYCIGDRFTLNVQVEKDCCLTLLDRGTSGKLFVLAENIPVKAGRPLAIAGPDSDRDWLVGEPEGVEQIKAFFTLQPLCLLPGRDPDVVSIPHPQTRDIFSTSKPSPLPLEEMPIESWTDASCEFAVSKF